MKRILPFLIVGVVFAGTLAGGGLFLRSKRLEEAASRAAAAAALKNGKPGAEPAHVRGPDTAKITLEEFADFECPPCGNMSPVLEKFEQDFAGRMRVIFRQLPHAVHLHAFRAAYASEAAGLQGKFWDMHDLLFHERLVWPKSTDIETTFEEYAGKLGLDVDRFKKDMEGEKVKNRVAADQERAASLKIDATPTILINGDLVPVSSLNPDGLRAAIEAALKK